MTTTLDVAGVKAKLVAVEKAHGYQVKEQKRKNVFLENEKKKLAQKVDELDEQVQQHQADLLALLPPIS